MIDLEPEITTYEDALKAIKNTRHRAFVPHYLATLNKTKAAELAGVPLENAAKQGWRMSINVHVRTAIELGFAERSMGKFEVLERLGEIARASMEEFLTLEQIEYREKIPVPAFERAEQLRGRMSEALDRIETSADLNVIGSWRLIYNEADLELGKLPDGPLEIVYIEGPIRKSVQARIDLVKAEKAGKLHLLKKVKQTDRGLEVELHDAMDALELIGKHHKLFTDRVSLENPDGTPLVLGIEVVQPAEATDDSSG